MAVSRFERLFAKTKTEFPRLNIQKRDDSWLAYIFWFLKKITKQDYASFTTTIFSTMYVGSEWSSDSDDEKYQTLRHEKKHIKQFHCWPLGRWAWPVNHVLMGLCYLLVLPVLWTFRSKFEREGYTQTLLAEFELHGTIKHDRMLSNAEWIADTFGGSAYFFMWRRKKAFDWALETQRKINAGEITNPDDRVVLETDQKENHS